MWRGLKLFCFPLFNRDIYSTGAYVWCHGACSIISVMQLPSVDPDPIASRVTLSVSGRIELFSFQDKDNGNCQCLCTDSQHWNSAETEPSCYLTPEIEILHDITIHSCMLELWFSKIPSLVSQMDTWYSHLIIITYKYNLIIYTDT